MPLLNLEVRVVDRTHLRIALCGLVAMNQALLARGGIPALYSSGVSYRQEHPDVWSTCDLVLARGFGDCEDLAAWRAAELRQAGENAIADVYRTGHRRWHCIVRRENGSIEDPSRRLGMGGKRMVG